jgi:excinuclease ABC subunit B
MGLSPVRARRSRWRTSSRRTQISSLQKADAGDLATTRRWPPSCTASSASSFRDNAVHYFVSYYDYYQPEAYIPQRDIYIEKDASINEEIDRLRLASTSSLVSRTRRDHRRQRFVHLRLGFARRLQAMVVAMRCGETIDRDEMLMRLVDIQYDRNDVAFERSKFRVRGDTSNSGHLRRVRVRIELWGDEIEQISIINPVSGEVIARAQRSVHLSGQALRDARGPHPRRSIRSEQELEEQLESFAAKASCWKRSG